MLSAIWELIGLVVGFIVLIPLVIFALVFVFVLIQSLFELAIKTGHVIAEKIADRLNRNN